MKSEIRSAPATTVTTVMAGQPMRFVRRVTSWLGSLACLWSDHLLALADQGVVSVASFVTTVIISRYSDAAQLGVYAIGISVLASMYTIQGQLISLPYSIQSLRPIGTPTERAGGALALAGLLASLTTFLLVLVALSLILGGAQGEITAITWALAGVMPFALSRDFFRRFAFTHLQMAQALILDATVAAFQLSLLGWLAWTDRMSAVTATIVLGGSCGMVAIAWLFLCRARFSIRVNKARAAMKESWKLGKWLVVNQMMVQIQRYSAYWLLVMVTGATATGIYTACVSIVAVTNPLFYGLNNLFTQKSVLAWQQGGGASLRRRAFKDFMLFSIALGPFCLVLVWFGEDVIHLVYRSQEYVGYGHVITILAFATFAFALGTPAGNALASMEQPRVVFVINAAGAVLTVLVVWRLLEWWALTGAAYGLLLSNAVIALALWIAFLLAVGRSRDDTAAREVLCDLVGTTDSTGWTITCIGEGDHSIVYTARSSDGGPIWRTYDALILKVYKPEARLSIDMVNTQFNSMLRSYRSLAGSKVNGWTVMVPMPLYVSKTPLALVMTAVGGKELKSSTAIDDELKPETLQSLGRAVVAVMLQSWSHGQIHGDLGLQNILYDVKMRQLAFIDPGTPECCLVCMHSGTRWKPEILELGHILRDLGTDIRDLAGHPTARLRREVFTESALRAFTETISSVDERRQALDEIFDCAQEHLSKVIQASWLLRTFFARPLSLFVARRMDAMLARLREQSATIAQATEKVEAVPLQPAVSPPTPNQSGRACSRAALLTTFEQPNGTS